MTDTGDLSEVMKLRSEASKHFKQGAFSEALKLLNDARALLGPGGANDVIAGILNEIGMVYRWQGLDADAIKTFDGALIYARKTNDNDCVMTVLLNKANVHRFSGDRVKAGELYEELLVLLRRSSDKNNLALILNDIAFWYEEIGLPSKALLYRREADTLPLPTFHTPDRNSNFHPPEHLPPPNEAEK